MDIKEKAVIRNQLYDVTHMQFELKADLKIVSGKLAVIENFLAETLTPKQRKNLKKQRQVYLENKNDIIQTLNQTSKVIKDLKLQATPRAYLFT